MNSFPTGLSLPGESGESNIKLWVSYRFERERLLLMTFDPRLAASPVVQVVEVIGVTMSDSELVELPPRMAALLSAHTSDRTPHLLAPARVRDLGHHG